MVKIICTVSEFGKIVRACDQSSCCCYCPLYPVCNGTDEGIEQFIRADLITDDAKEENE